MFKTNIIFNIVLSNIFINAKKVKGMKKKDNRNWLDYT